MTESKIIRINGPVVQASGLTTSHVYDVVRVGAAELVGEIVQLRGDEATIQVYEDTTGLRAGDVVEPTGVPFLVELGPGLLGNIYDGMQRPLKEMTARDVFIRPGTRFAPLDPNAKWNFVPCARAGDRLQSGDCIGTVQETDFINHRILVPPHTRGEIKEIAEGKFTIDSDVATLQKEDGTLLRLGLRQKWPARIARPVLRKCNTTSPLITGQRVLDTFFPTAKGGTAIIPGGFGTGKTILEQTLVRWAEADIIIFIGCGERGNEMAELLQEFPRLRDSRTNALLMERSILIANTSNMPVCAREGSIYLGITLAEYYRDMGYHVLLLADSTSRWGEALREVSGRLEEMPGEEGYPAYLGSRLAQFYERAGLAECLGREHANGSITIVGAISPPAGDFSEPVTQASMRVTGTLWSLDTDLARCRHFPAIQWQTSYSLYDHRSWYDEHVSQEWSAQVQEATQILQKENELQTVIQLVGPEALPESEKAILLTGRILREDFLQQSAYHPIDAFCPLEKQFWMLKVILAFHHSITNSVESGARVEDVADKSLLSKIAAMKTWPNDGFEEKAKELMKGADETSALQSAVQSNE